MDFFKKILKERGVEGGKNGLFYDDLTAGQAKQKVSVVRKMGFCS